MGLKRGEERTNVQQAVPSHPTQVRQSRIRRGDHRGPAKADDDSGCQIRPVDEYRSPGFERPDGDTEPTRPDPTNNGLRLGRKRTARHRRSLTALTRRSV